MTAATTLCRRLESLLACRSDVQLLEVLVLRELARASPSRTLTDRLFDHVLEGAGRRLDPWIRAERLYLVRDYEGVWIEFERMPKSVLAALTTLVRNKEFKHAVYTDNTLDDLAGFSGRGLNLARPLLAGTWRLLQESLTTCPLRNAILSSILADWHAETVRVLEEVPASVGFRDPRLVDLRGIRKDLEAMMTG